MKCTAFVAFWAIALSVFTGAELPEIFTSPYIIVSLDPYPYGTEYTYLGNSLENSLIFMRPNGTSGIYVSNASYNIVA